MAGSRSGAILPGPTPASAVARAPVTAGGRAVVPVIPAVRVAVAVSAETTTIVVTPAVVANRATGARGAGVQGPVIPNSVATALGARNGPIAAAARNGPELRGSVNAVPTGQEAVRLSAPKVPVRTGRTTVRAVHGRSRVQTGTRGSTERASAATSGHKGVLLPAMPIAAGTTVAPGVRTAEVVRTIAGSAAVRQNGPLAAPTIAASAEAAGPIAGTTNVGPAEAAGPIAGAMSAVSVGALGSSGRPMSVVSADVVHPTGATVEATGRAGTAAVRPSAAVRDSPAVARPAGPGVVVVRAGVVGPIDGRRGRMSPIYPTRSRPVISIPRSGGTC